MTLEAYRFKVGDFECIAINDGDIDDIPAPNFFDGAAPEDLAAAFARHGIHRPTLLIPVTILCIDTSDHRVLIDTGGGETPHPGFGKLFDGLRREGIQPEDIDTVALSHGHWDHVCGSTHADGSLAFPNARFVMNRDEYAYWTKQNSGGEVYRNLAAIRASVDLIGPNEPVVPGIESIYTPGHTPHHSSFMVRSNGEALYCLMDTVDHALHLERIDWKPNWDELPAKSVESRRALFGRACREEALVHGFHLPFPGVGSLTEIAPDSWRYQPLGK